MKMKIKMKKILLRHDVTRPRSHKFSKIKNVSQYDDAYMYQGTPKQHLKPNSWKS